jgi:hypothetical protein
VFWCSGIHKDGLVLSAIGVILYCCFRLLTKGVSLKYIFVVVFSGLIVFALRNYLLFAFLPPLGCWILSHYFPRRQRAIFFAMYLCIIITILAAPLAFPGADLSSYIVNKRQEFLHLPAGSLVDTTSLSPGAASMISFFPKAIDMAFLRPHLSEIKNISYVAALIENLIFVGLIVVFAVTVRKGAEVPAVILCMATFAISVLVICGYTIPITGAIVRYKSVVLPLLVTPLICMIDLSQIRKRTHL